MTQLRQGARLLEAGDQTYRWFIVAYNGREVLVIEQAEPPGQRVGVFLDELSGPVTPALVRRAVDTARAAGWNPAAPLGELLFHLHKGEVVPDWEMVWDAATMAMVRRPRR
jgi:hypothetical protein